MIVKVNYDRDSATITVTCDEEDVNVEVNTNEITDDQDELDFEIAVDLSYYQESFNDDILDGDNN